MGDFDVTATAEALAVVVPKLRRRLREHGSLGDLTPSQVAVLLRIERDGRSTAARLAQAESMRPQSMGAIVAALQEMKFLESSPDPDDRRQSILSLTASCKRRIKVNRAARRDWLSQLIQAKFTAAEQKQLAQCVGLLRRLADDGQESP
jgi:DNA-binding MarR family transcriptional regulator